MKKQLIALCAVIALATPAFAAMQLGLGANTLNGMSYGSVGLYDAQWDVSLGYNTKTTSPDGGSDTSVSNMFLEGHYKMPAGDNLNMTFGALYKSTDDDSVDSSSAMGLSIGLETNLTDNLVLGGYYFPLYTTTEKDKAGVETTTSQIGNVVQMKATYLLDVL